MGKERICYVLEGKFTLDPWNPELSQLIRNSNSGAQALYFFVREELGFSILSFSHPWYYLSVLLTSFLTISLIYWILLPLGYKLARLEFPYKSKYIQTNLKINIKFPQTSQNPSISHTSFSYFLWQS